MREKLAQNPANAGWPRDLFASTQATPSGILISGSEEPATTTPACRRAEMRLRDEAGR
jgi:hypothetical protein